LSPVSPTFPPRWASTHFPLLMRFSPPPPSCPSYRPLKRPRISPTAATSHNRAHLNLCPTECWQFSSLPIGTSKHAEHFQPTQKLQEVCLAVNFPNSFSPGFLEVSDYSRSFWPVAFLIFFRVLRQGLFPKIRLPFSKGLPGSYSCFPSALSHLLVTVSP